MGDGGLATDAAFDNLSGLAVDVAGNLFVVDNQNERLRRVDAVTGIITTVAERGGIRDVAVDMEGNVFIAFSDAVLKMDAVTGTITTVLSRREHGIVGVGGVSVDTSGNLFVSVSYDTRIFRVDVDTGAVATVAGTGERGFAGDGGPASDAQFNQPSGIAIDADGNLFISDAGNDRVRRVDFVTGIITTVAGKGDGGRPCREDGDWTCVVGWVLGGYSGDGGPSIDAELNSPAGLATDAEGNLYVADGRNNRVRRISSTSGIITTVAGTGEDGFSGDGGLATSATLSRPRGLAVDGRGNLFITDSGNERVRRVDAATGIITTVAGTGRGDGGPAIGVLLKDLEGVAVDSVANLFIVSWDNPIRRVDAATGVISTVPDLVWPQLTGATGIVVDEAGNLFIANRGGQNIMRVDGDTGIITTVAGTGENGFGGDGGAAMTALLSYPEGVAVDSAANLFIADTDNGRIRRVDSETGIITTVAGTGENGFGGDGGPATSASLDGPTGVAFDAEDNLFIADTRNDRIRRVDSETGIITTVAGTGENGFGGDGGPATSAILDDPNGVAVDAMSNLFIADTNNDRIRMVATDTGIITTVAGTGEEGFGGDGGLATSALLDEPHGLAVDAAGNLFIADTDNERIRAVAGIAAGVTPTATTPRRVVVALFTGFLGSSGDDIGIEQIHQLLLDESSPRVEVMARRFGHTHQQSAVEFVVSNAERSEIVLIGHSFGGDSAIEVAESVSRLSLTVYRLVQIDSVGVRDNILPGNVGHGLNFFQEATELLEPQGERFVQGSTNVRGEVHFGLRDETLTHTNIDNFPALQAEVVAFAIDGALPRGPGVSAPGVSITIRGSVIAHNTTTPSQLVESITFQLSNASPTGQAVSLAAAELGIQYIDSHQAWNLANVSDATATQGWTATWLSGSGPLLNPGDRVELTVGLQSLSPRLGVSQWFLIRVSPSVGATLVVERNTPSELLAVADLK